MSAEKKRRLTYRSPGTDDVWVPCDSVEELVCLFRADAETFAEDNDSEPFIIKLGICQMTDAEVEALPTI